MARSGPPRGERGALARAAAATAAATAALLYLPLGASGLLALAWLGLGLFGLMLQRWTVETAAVRWPMLWMAWLGLSLAWTVAPWSTAVRQWSHGLVLLAVPVVAATLAPAAARRALRCFVAGSALMALAWWWHQLWPLPAGRLLSSMVHYSGNKSIANGVLMALAAAMALRQAFMAGAATRSRWGWAALAAALALSVLVCSAARTAHLVLAVLGLALVWIHCRSVRVRLTALAVAALLAAAVLAGLAGLQARSQAGQLQASNSNRVELYRETVSMAAERPISGHGVGSWAVLWEQRNQTPALRGFSTAHSVPLELLAEGGVISLGLVLACFLVWRTMARRAGWRGDGGPAALVLLAWGTTALVNAALRDAVFAAPMAVLLGLALAQTRERDLNPE